MINLIRKSTTPIRAIIATAMLLIVVAIISITSVSYADSGSSDKNGRLVTIHDRGLERVILTNATTIGDSLKEAGISTDPKDLIEPSADEKLISSNYQVNIYRARPIIVVDGNIRQKVITPYQTAEQICQDAGIVLYDEDITKIDRTDNIVDGVGIQLTINRAISFRFTLYGQTSIARSQNQTVGDMLSEKGIKLTKDDRVSVDLNTKLTEDLVIRVWREGRQTITVDEAVDFEIEKIENADLDVGYREIKIAGEKGTKSVTYEITIQDGKEVSRKEIASLLVKQPKKQVEIVGVKNNYSGSLNEWLLALRTCETGGSYTRNSGNGYYGAYQFLPGTWNSTASKVGRTDLVGVRPDMASPIDQDTLIVANTRMSGGGLASQNPGCYHKLGLSQFPPN